MWILVLVLVRKEVLRPSGRMGRGGLRIFEGIELSILYFLRKLGATRL